VRLLLSALTGGASAIVVREHRYHYRAFLAPPWPEIYVTDPERRHSLEAAVAEYRRLLDVYPSLGYEVTILPKVSVPERADFVLNTLAESLD
jgi:predicted ATPase